MNHFSLLCFILLSNLTHSQTSQDCAWIEPVFTTTGLQYPVPSGACHNEWTIYGEYKSEMYECMSPTEIIHKQYDDTWCRDSSLIDIQYYDATQAGFNCNTSQSCTEVEFDQFNACGYNDSEPDYESGSMRGHYAANTCANFISGNNFRIECNEIGGGFILYQYVDTKCTIPIGDAILMDECVGLGPYIDVDTCGDIFSTDIYSTDINSRDGINSTYIYVARDLVFCPWVSYGLSQIVSPSYCNVNFDSATDYNESISAYKWECLDHRMIRYTSYTDTECTLSDEIEEYGSYGTCQGCGYTTFAKDGGMYAFDCSWFDVYDESNCNYAIWKVGSECDDVGGLLSEEEDVETRQFITDICFGGDWDSYKLLCEEDGLHFEEYTDGYCQVIKTTNYEIITPFCNSTISLGWDFSCVDSFNIPDIDTTVYCPWFNNPEEHYYMELINVCTIEGFGSHMAQCQDYGVVQFLHYSSANCTGQAAMYEVGTYGDHCAECGPITRDYNGTSYQFDCSYYTRYDENNCNVFHFVEGELCSNESAQVFFELYLVADACFVQDSFCLSKIWYNEDGSAEVMVIGYFHEVTPSCNSTSGMGISMECIQGEIPSDSDGDGAYPVEEVLCPWYSTENDNSGRPIGFCAMAKSGTTIYSAEYYECVDEYTLRRSVWADTLPVSCAGETLLVEDITAKGRRRIQGIDVTYAYFDREFTFDCSNYSSFDADNSPCDLVFVNLSHSGCDESGNLYDDIDIGVYILGCWALNESSIKISHTANCNQIDVTHYNGTDCSSDPVVAFSYIEGCNPSPYQDNITARVDVESECANMEYMAYIEPQCPYYWGLFDDLLIRPIDVCQVSSHNTSYKVTCGGNDTLIYTQYSTSDCSADYVYRETEGDALLYRCDGIPDCIMDACIGHDLFGSFSNTCDDDKLSVMQYSTPNCSGDIIENMTTIYTGCDSISTTSETPITTSVSLVFDGTGTVLNITLSINGSISVQDIIDTLQDTITNYYLIAYGIHVSLQVDIIERDGTLIILIAIPDIQLDTDEINNGLEAKVVEDLNDKYGANVKVKDITVTVYRSPDIDGNKDKSHLWIILGVSLLSSAVVMISGFVFNKYKQHKVYEITSSNLGATHGNVLNKEQNDNVEIVQVNGIPSNHNDDTDARNNTDGDNKMNEEKENSDTQGEESMSASTTTSSLWNMEGLEVVRAPTIGIDNNVTVGGMDGMDILDTAGSGTKGREHQMSIDGVMMVSDTKGPELQMSIDGVMMVSDTKGREHRMSIDGV